MRALLLAAGYGTRLRPLTDTIPKCLVPINGEPLLGIWLKILFDGGISEVTINTHYLESHVTSYVNESKYKKKVNLVNEPVLLGTAGTLIENLGFYQGGDGLLIHADNYCDINLKALISAHKKRPINCVLTMVTFRTDSPSTCGIVETDENNVITAFHEKVESPPGNLANGAIYILSKEFISEIRTLPDGASDFSIDILPKYIGRMFSYETNGYIIDIGTPDSYKRANELHCNT